MPRFLWRFIVEQKKSFLIAFSVVLIWSILWTTRAYVRADLFGTTADALRTDGGREIFLGKLLNVGGTELLLFGVGIILVAVMTRMRGFMNLHVRLFGVDRVIEQDYQHIAKFGSGKLLQIVHSGMESYSYLIYEGLNNIVVMVVSLAVIVRTLSAENIWFLSYFVGACILLFVFQKLAFKQLTASRLKDKTLNEAYTKQTAKMLMNFILLKIFGIKDQELEHLRSIGETRVKNYTYIKFWFNGVASMANFLLIILLLISMWYFGSRYLDGSMDGTSFFFIFTLMGRARGQFYRFGNFVAELSEKMTYIHRFDEVVSEQTVDETNDTSLDSLAGMDITIDGISYHYDGASDNLFENLSLSFPFGEKTAIVGRSGSGKSTLCKLLTRLVSPQQGSIQLGEESLSAITYASVFSSLGYFYQDPLVFDGTLRENLSLNAALDDTALIAALHKVSLGNMSLDTIIGERGVLLSGGEKQRLALARIFLFDYDIILLDEPTSNLDLQLEKEILGHIFEHCKDKTLLIISHRPFVLDYVDRVIVMHKGEIKADGSFKEVRDDIEGLD